MEDKPIATTIIEMLKTSIRRMYIGLIIVFVLLIISLVDSIQQRKIISDLIINYEKQLVEVSKK